MAGELGRRLKIDPATGSLVVSESSIEEGITAILEYDGWRSFKMERNFSEKKQRAFGEAGMPDRLYVRYAYGGSYPKFASGQCISEVLFIEHKSAKGIASAAQKLWHAAERKRGALTLIAGVDFVASIDGFLSWYESSGLKRRV